MPPYQQKTDNREFEVANSEPYSGASGGDARAGGSEIALRLWTADQNVARTWKAESVLVYMIADLVAASGGQVAEAEQAVMAAKFDSPRQALVAAKRIQTSILEFVACRPGERAGAAILIYQSRSGQSSSNQSSSSQSGSSRPGSSDPSGLSGELARMALEKARPGQILLAENVSQRLRDLPGAEFRTVDGLTEDGPTGLTEWMWTTAERFAELQESVGPDAEQAKKSEFRGNDAPEVGATSIVQSPFARPGTSDQSVRPRETGGDLAKGGPRTATKREDQIANRTQDRAPGFEGFRESPGGSFGEGLDEFEEPPLFTRARVIFGVVALVLVTAVILVLFRPTKVSKPPLPLQPEQSVGTDSSVHSPAPPTSVGSQPAVTPEQAAPSTAEPRVTVPVASSQTSSKVTADNRVKSKKGNAEESTPVEVGGFSQRDIHDLLQMAQTDAGAGRYDDARIRYQKVLALQPSNQEAKEGLHKLEIAQKERQ